MVEPTGVMSTTQTGGRPDSIVSLPPRSDARRRARAAGCVSEGGADSPDGENLKGRPESDGSAWRCDFDSTVRIAFDGD